MQRLHTELVSGKFNVCFAYILAGFGLSATVDFFMEGRIGFGVFVGILTFISMSIGLSEHIQSASEAYIRGLNEPRPSIRSVDIDE